MKLEPSDAGGVVFSEIAPTGNPEFPLRVVVEVLQLTGLCFDGPKVRRDSQHVHDRLSENAGNCGAPNVMNRDQG